MIEENTIIQLIKPTIEKKVFMITFYNKINKDNKTEIKPEIYSYDIEYYALVNTKYDLDRDVSQSIIPVIEDCDGIPGDLILTSEWEKVSNVYLLGVEKKDICENTPFNPKEVFKNKYSYLLKSHMERIKEK